METICNCKDNAGDNRYMNGGNMYQSMGGTANHYQSGAVGKRKKAGDEDSFEALLQKMKERLGTTNANSKSKSTKRDM